MYPHILISVQSESEYSLVYLDRPTGEDIQYHDLADSPQCLRLLCILSSTGHQLRQVSLFGICFQNICKIQCLKINFQICLQRCWSCVYQVFHVCETTKL